MPRGRRRQRGQVWSVRYQPAGPFTGGFLRQALGLGIDGIGRCRAVRFSASWSEHLQARRSGPISGREGDWSQSRTHTPAGDHLAGNVGGLLHVIFRARGVGIEEDFFSRSNTNCADNPIMMVMLAVAVPIVFGS